MDFNFWTWRWPKGFLALVFGAGLVLTLSASPVISKLPPLQVHPLPMALAEWKDAKNSGDYFDQVKRVPVGYLVWSQFPISVYIQPLTPEESANPFTAKRSKDWIKAVSAAVQEWNPYLPLKIVNQSQAADITVWRSPPPLRLEPASTGQAGAIRESRPTLSLGRARSAETRFEFYAQPLPADSHPGATQQDVNQTPPPAPLPPSASLLAQRFTIHLRPDQAPSYLQASARHELGHALGIWGHSPLETDVMYFSQVRNPPAISPRDLNTLKKVYEQPTRLGWRCPTQACG
ncbi:MAG: peptidase [Kovacikia sp.]